MKWDKWIEKLKKGKFVLIILLAGILLMALPTGKKREKVEADEGFSLVATEQRMEEILGKIDGVGRIDVMLTLKSSSQLTLAQDHNDTRRQEEEKSQSQVLTVNRGSGCQEVVVTEELYPVYQGAVVVCEGAGSDTVRLRILETVSVLTGLRSDKISVVQWQS